MKLTRLCLENVRSVADGEYAFAHPDGRPFDIALVTGPAASGKTTMLAAVAMAVQRVAPTGRPAKPRDFLRAGHSNGRVEPTFVLSEAELERFQLRDPIARFEVLLSGAASEVDPRLTRLLQTVDRFDYLPDNRRLTEPMGMEPPPDEHTERRIRLSNDADKYRGVVPWLRAELLRQASQLSARLREGGMLLSTDTSDPLADFRTTLADLCPWLRLEGLALDGRTPMFIRDDGSNPPLFELSAAEQDAVLLCATLQRFPHQDRIVLWDRADLHAHPDDQLRWLRSLQARSGCQLVVSATSERLTRDLPAEQQVKLNRGG